MREIKFRAWEKDKKIMRNVLDINFEGYENALRNIKYENGKRDYNVENFILMQFTGLKDKNGKEIYEGDILEYYLTSDDDRNVCVIYGYNEYRLVHDFEEYRNSKHSNGYFEFDSCSNWTIIGNIHDNPELLKTN